MPVVVLLLVITGLHFIDFKYVDQVIIVSGPIMAALISLYVVKNNNKRGEEEKQKDIDTRLEYIFSLIESGLRSVRKECNNYMDFISEINEKGMAELGLKTSSFHLIKQSIEYNQGEFYRSIAHNNPDKIEEAKKYYLRITNASQHAVFLQENARSEYEKYIENYNIKARNYRQAQIDLNNLHSHLKANPSGNFAFDNAFFQIVQNYNQGIFDKVVNPFRFEDVRDSLIKPLAQLLNSGFVPRNAFFELQRIYKELEVSLNKMEEIQQITTNHLDDISNHLTSVADQIENSLLFFGVKVTDASYLELKPIEDDEKLELLRMEELNERK